MKIHDLRQKQANFEPKIESIKDRKDDLYKLRASFVKYFSIPGIQRMNVDRYVLGKEKPATGFNFCYGLERQLKGLGWMIGGTSLKFGFYYGRTKSDQQRRYRYSRLFGSSPSEAIATAKKLILDLLKHGKAEDLDAIIQNPLSPMFKGKILATYFPERYFNVFASSHLDYFLMKLNLDTKDLLRGDEVIKREMLLTFKNDDVVMKTWPIDIYSDFLYDQLGRPPSAGTIATSRDPLRDYRSLVFPTSVKAEFIDLEMGFAHRVTDDLGRSKLIRKRIDYEMDERRNRELGSRGEKIVMDLEGDRLKSLGRNDLAKRVKRVSLESDSFGYDIISYESDGRERLIEVKATSAKVGSVDFYITANELATALSTKNFFVYMVYDILSTSPKVWPIKNPFDPENRALVKIPVKYRCTIKTA